MVISEEIIKKWYKVNKILIGIFIVWALLIPMGILFVPYNYYYYHTDELLKYDRGTIIEKKLSLNLSNDSRSFFPFRNRQRMRLSVWESGIENIFLEKITIYTENDEKLYERKFSMSLKDIYLKNKDGYILLFENKNLKARKNKKATIEVVLYIEKERIIREFKLERVKQENSIKVYQAIFGGLTGF